MEHSKEENKALCDRYPFLIPWNRWSGKRITDAQDGGYWPGKPDEVPEYDYEYTELDDMPDGWRKAFGILMCEEIRDALIDDDDLDRYRVVQIKEKYGSLCWYDNGIKATSLVHDIIRRYEHLSARTCIVCGKPATRITLGWISPFCDDCCLNCGNGRSMDIDEYFRKEEDEYGTDDHSNGMDG